LGHGADGISFGDEAAVRNLRLPGNIHSKELTSEITLKNGNKITTIKPNLNDKVANVLAGIVDLTVRAFMDGDERYLLLEKKENVFGGGRFNFKVPVVKLDKENSLKP